MGVMFSVSEANIELKEEDQKIIDDFFESLKWDITTGTPTAEEVPYGNLMMMVNTKDRWVYKGSVTTPPCATYVYWNVLTTIYPIKQSTLDNFKKQLARKTDLEKYGNYREIQKLDLQQPKILKAKVEDKGVTTALLVIFIAFTLLFIVTTVFGCIKINKLEEEINKESAEAPSTARKNYDPEVEMP